jgi:hypothetical protein
VKEAVQQKYPLKTAASIDVESCGKSRVLLAGLGNSLHQNNVRYLLNQYAIEEGIDLIDSPFDDFDDDIVDE